jgi:hypothetical protein
LITAGHRPNEPSNCSASGDSAVETSEEPAISIAPAARVCTPASSTRYETPSGSAGGGCACTSKRSAASTITVRLGAIGSAPLPPT